MLDEIVIFVTTSSTAEAERIGNKLVEDKLVACVNVIPNIRSIFHWQGESCNEEEVLMILKSVRANLEKIIKNVKQLHSYEVPEVIAIPIIGGSQEYLDWVNKETEH